MGVTVAPPAPFKGRGPPAEKLALSYAKDKHGWMFSLVDALRYIINKRAREQTLTGKTHRHSCNRPTSIGLSV